MAAIDCFGDGGLADYFVICGLDLRTGLEPDNLAGESLHCTPLDRPFKSKVLAHYPQNVSWNPFDESAVGMLCMPRGLRFCTQKHKCQQSFHSFIITRENGSRTYGQCHTFYEEVMDKKICEAMHTLQAMHLTELSVGTSSEIQRVVHSGVELGSSRSLPRSFKLGSFSASSTSGALYDRTRDKLFVTKCICLITQLPAIVSCRKFLEGLYKQVLLNEIRPLPLESYVYNILFEVPLPPPNHGLRFFGFEHQLVCQRPGPDELPFFEYSFSDLFCTLGVDNIIQLYTCVLLENQVLLFSEEYEKLMLVAECITTLLFPFTWQHVYVPILPASLHHFLDAPVPFIMGLQRKRNDNSNISIPGEANVCLVDIDSRTMEVPEDTPKFPCKNELLSEILSTLKNYGMKFNKPSRNSNKHGPPLRPNKFSWTVEENNTGLGAKSFSIKNSCSELASDHSSLSDSEALQRVTAIAKRTGVMKNMNDKPRSNEAHEKAVIGSPERSKEETRKYVEMLKLNNAVREIFLNRLIHMFRSYENFVIQPSQHDMEQWLTTRESMQNFDKTAFLSDQPEPHLPFLSRFIETQMFATFIDNKIVSVWEKMDPFLKIFDSRIRLILSESVHSASSARSHTYEQCETYHDTEILIEKRVYSADITAPLPKQIECVSDFVSTKNHIRGQFPFLDMVVLNYEDTKNRSKQRHINQSRELNNHHVHQKESLSSSYVRCHKLIREAKNKTLHAQKQYDVSPALISQTYWKFVVALLKECKTRTKRMLVEKMGQEAVELGHNEISINGIEENTLIASLCDLLERVWSHGLQSKQGKSALWSHLVSYCEIEECKCSGKPIDPNFLTPARPDDSMWNLGLLLLKASALTSIVHQLTSFDIASLTFENDSMSQKDTKEKKAKTTDSSVLKPLPVSLICDIKNIQAMTEIKTDIGCARAWVRLVLEKKLLSKHLKKLLSNHKLLQSLYKRYAFLRCDDEKEQFLCHLLTLNAVDYYCFTNTFTATVIPYRILVFPSKKLNASTTANAWIVVAGTLGESKQLSLNKQTLEILFQHKNLGILTTVRIGHDNTGISPKWMVEHVIVRNEITGHTYKFPCGRWLGKGVDDGSTERLLVGELIPRDHDTDELVEKCRTPPRCRSPSSLRRHSEPKLKIPEIQQLLGDAVNNIVKYYYKPEKERGSLTILLCGELGLVYCLEQAFLYGFKASRFFRHIFLWDFFAKVKAHFESVLANERASERNVLAKSREESLEHVVVMKSFCALMEKIENSSCSVGKDGKFQLFICFAARDHLLHRMILHMASTSVTSNMYEEQSFLRDPQLASFLVEILESLSDFTIVLETSLTKGIET